MGNTRFEIVLSGRSTWMKGIDISKIFNFPNYRVLLYIYVSGENAVVNMVITSKRVTEDIYSTKP